jgi:hypothetical protein
LRELMLKVGDEKEFAELSDKVIIKGKEGN